MRQFYFITMVYYKAMASRPRPAEDYRYWGGPSPSVSDNVKMDPLSLSASILTVLSAAIATAEVIEALRTVKNVPVQVIAVTNEVGCLLSFLQTWLANVGG